MKNLFNLQEHFQNHLLKKPTQIENIIVSTAKVAASTRLGIYFDAYQSRLCEALIANYPQLNNYLGDESFQELALNYLDLNPSKYRSIRWFGEDFSVFLQNSAHEQAAFLAELAEFEWKMTLAFDAIDEEQLTLEQMARVAPEAWASMRFITHSSLHYLTFSWNVIAIWQELSINHPPLPIQKLEPASNWVLWRRDYLNRFYAIASEDENWALKAVIQGSTFSDICQGLCQWFDEQEVGLRAASLLKGWIQSGLLARIDFA